MYLKGETFEESDFEFSFLWSDQFHLNEVWDVLSLVPGLSSHVCPDS